MRIKTFCKFVEVSETESYSLQNCEVVFDGQNYFYNLYQKSGLPFAFGCESDRYANYLRQHLGMFKKSNVKCYFLFKGGDKNIEKKKVNNNQRNKLNPANYVAGEQYDDTYIPLLAREVYKEVLKEMGFDYTFCQFESKKECIALAQKLGCPVISFDIEFCFTGVPYIPYNTLTFNERKNTIDCALFRLEKFLKKYSLTEEKLAIFIVMTDQKIFPGDFFLSLYQSLRMPLGHFKRNLSTLQWLSRMTRDRAIDTISKFISLKDKNTFLEKESEVRAMIRRQEVCGLPSQYFENGNNLPFSQSDPMWFEKGVACKHIVVPYVNLYRSSFILGSIAIEDTNAEDAMMLSIDTIKYAYNLLTNFQNPEFIIYKKLEILESIQLQDVIKHEENGVVFQNGWDEVRSLGLFQRFLKESLKDIDLERLETLPEDARLLMISLIYFSRKKAVDTLNEAHSVILSYVMLGVVFEKSNNQELNDAPEERPTKDAKSSKDVTKPDCDIAADRLVNYFKLSDSELREIFDRKTLHPLVEYQYCLQNMNYLNKLCGSPYKATIYSKTYNGTFVYKVLYALKKNPGSDNMIFMKNLLEPAASVLSFVNDLIKCYEDMIY